MFSVIIPSFNNLELLKICLNSLKFFFNNEIIIHVNEGIDGTLEFLDKENYNYTFKKYNAGVCVAFNEAVKNHQKLHRIRA